MYIVFKNEKTCQIFARNIDEIDYQPGWIKVILNMTESVDIYPDFAKYNGYNYKNYEVEILEMVPDVSIFWGKV